MMPLHTSKWEMPNTQQMLEKDYSHTYNRRSPAYQREMRSTLIKAVNIKRIAEIKGWIP